MKDHVFIKGKFLFQNNNKFFIQGVTYGPFKDLTPSLSNKEKIQKDFNLISEAGFNTIRMYTPPSKYLLDKAEEFNLKVIVTIPWSQRDLFLDSKYRKKEIINNIKSIVNNNYGHKSILAYYVDNEIPSDFVRWYGSKKIEKFIDHMARTIKDISPDVLVSYGNFPPTEYLLPEEIDFISYNLYLHRSRDLSLYLSRINNLSKYKPIIVGEFGMDTIRHGEDQQSILLSTYWDEIFKNGLSGGIVFSWTDEWHTDNTDIEDWAFGLVKKDRSFKKSYKTLALKTFSNNLNLIDKFPLDRYPKVSVVVCSYNGAKTLRKCLEALQRINYPNYEIILVDDGSKDETQIIASEFPNIKNIFQYNQGLSSARNTGYKNSTGEIIAYTDSDCEPDEDWLYFIVKTLINTNYIGVGGPNLSPTPSSNVNAAITVSKGTPTHVLINDTEAEHIPGCNMAYWKYGLENINGFDETFRTAGDDVDLCWRFIKSGYKIGFNPSAIVWHHRRHNINLYLKQQRGYGEAEALLRLKHMEQFNNQGIPNWKGKIYEQINFKKIFLDKPTVYHGIFGSASFQCLYEDAKYSWTNSILGVKTVMSILFISLLSIFFGINKLIPVFMILCSTIPAFLYTLKVQINKRYDNLFCKFLVFFLAIVQPIVRDATRYLTWMKKKNTGDINSIKINKDTDINIRFYKTDNLAFWNSSGLCKDNLLKEIIRSMQEENWKYFLDTGWNNWDIQIFSNIFWYTRLKSLTEIYPHNERIIRINQKIVLANQGVLFIICLIFINLLMYLFLFNIFIPCLIMTSFILSYLFIIPFRLKYNIAYLIQISAARIKFKLLNV